MKMSSFSNIACISLVAVVVSGCVISPANLVSSSGFEVYISKQRYLNESCDSLLRMRSEYNHDRVGETRKHLGLEPFSYDVAAQHERDMVRRHGKYIFMGIANKCG